MDFCYGYPDYPCAYIPIDELAVPEECKSQMKRLGLELVGDILDLYQNIGAGAMDVGVGISSKCYSSIFRYLLEIECCPWPDEVEEWLVNWVENEI